MIEAIIKGLGLGLVLALSVGPVIFTILKQSINNGHRGGFSFVAGVWISDIILVILSNFFSELVRDLLSFKSLIALAGGIFLAGMGLFYIFLKKIDLRQADTGFVPGFTTKDFSRLAFSGFLINTLNPSVLIFWLMNATAFSALHSFGERMMIFTVCILVNVAADVLKVMMAGKIRSSLTPAHISIVNKVSGLLLLIFGAILMYGAGSLKNG